MKKFYKPYEKLEVLPQISPNEFLSLNKQAYMAGLYGESLDSVTNAFTMLNGIRLNQEKTMVDDLVYRANLQLKRFGNQLEEPVEETAKTIFKTEMLPIYQNQIETLSSDFRMREKDLIRIRREFNKTCDLLESERLRNGEPPAKKSFLDYQLVSALLLLLIVCVETYFMGSALANLGWFQTWAPAYAIGFTIATVFTFLIENQNFENHEEL